MTGVLWAVFPSRESYEKSLEAGIVTPDTPVLITGSIELRNKVGAELEKIPLCLPTEEKERIIREIFARVRQEIQQARTPTEQRQRMYETVKTEVQKVISESPTYEEAVKQLTGGITINQLLPVIGLVLSIVGVFMLIKFISSLIARFRGG